MLKPQAAIKDVPGAIDVHVEQQVLVPQIQIKLKLAAGAKYGIEPGDIRRAASVLLTGIEVTDLRRDGKVYGVWLWASENARGNIESLREFLLDTPYGGRVRLGDATDVEFVPTPNKIKRENNSRRIDDGETGFSAAAPPAAPWPLRSTPGH